MTVIASDVRKRADYRCEYCLLPQAIFRRPFHVEHIMAKQHGGLTELDNLALACWQCNLKKGPNLTGIDPETGEVTRLFDPRKNNWAEHFEFQDTSPGLVLIVGKTPIGRATVVLLDMNEELRQAIRYELRRL